MHVEAGWYFLLDQLPPTQIQSRRLHNTHSITHNIISHRRTPETYLSPLSPDQRNPGFGLVICVIPDSKGTIHISTLVFLGQSYHVLLLCNRLLALAVSSNPRHFRGSRQPGVSQVLVQHGSIQCSKPQFNLNLNRSLIVLNRLRTVARKTFTFTTSSEKQSSTGAQPQILDCVPMFTVTIQFCPSGTPLHLCGHGQCIPEPSIAPYGTTRQDQHLRNHQRPTDKTRSSSPSCPARCECSSQCSLSATR